MSDRSAGAPRAVAASRSRRRRIAFALLAVIGIGSVLAVAKPWRPLVYGRAEPPAPDLSGLDEPVADRIARETSRVRGEPYSPEAWGDLGAVLDIHDLKADAIVCYERAARLDPDDFRWPYFLASCREVGDQLGALADFERAAELKGDHAPLFVHIGRGRILAGDLDGAADAFARAAALDRALVRAHLGLAEVAMARGDSGAAIEHLERAIAQGPESGEVERMLAEAHRALGHDAEADRYTRSALDRPTLEPLPDTIRARLVRTAGESLRWRRARAEAYMELGRTDDAMREWQDAARVYPDASEPHGQIGMLHARAGRSADAIASFERALELNPMEHGIRSNLGSLLISQGRAEDGLEQLRQACRFMPDSADASFNLAAALRSLGRTQEAMDAFARVLLIDPDHLRARFDYGTLAATEGRFDEAAAAFRYVADAEPMRRSAHVNLAQALRGADRAAEEIAALRAAVAALPADAKLTNMLAWRLATCTDPSEVDGDEARRLVEPLCRQTGYSDPVLLDTLAAACAAAGDFEAAVRYGEQAVTVLRSVPAQGGAGGAGGAGGGDRRDNAEELARIRTRLDLYRRGEAYVDSR